MNVSHEDEIAITRAVKNGVVQALQLYYGKNFPKQVLSTIATNLKTHTEAVGKIFEKAGAPFTDDDVFNTF